MSIETVTMYRVVCDWPGCKASAQDDSDYHAWGQADSAWIEAEDWGWEDAHTAEVIYCKGHPCAWASDHEGDEPYPEPPYLLIHDGDTGDFNDDGKVTLIEVPA